MHLLDVPLRDIADPRTLGLPRPKYHFHEFFETTTDRMTRGRFGLCILLVVLVVVLVLV
jgi:hypothetical protein